MGDGGGALPLSLSWSRSRAAVAEGLEVAYRSRDGWGRARSSWARANDRNGRRRAETEYALITIQHSSTQNDPRKTTNIDVVEGHVSFTETPSEIKMVEK